MIQSRIQRRAQARVPPANAASGKTVDWVDEIVPYRGVIPFTRQSVRCHSPERNQSIESFGIRWIRAVESPNFTTSDINGWTTVHTNSMKLKHWLRYALTHDTTWHGQFKALKPLLLSGSKTVKTVVDVGANDGFYSSNSYPFIWRKWSALLVEPNPVAFANAQRLHQANRRVTVLNKACGDVSGKMDLTLYAGDDGGSLSGFETGSPRQGPPAVGSVRIETVLLETLLAEQGVDTHFGLLSIDTEGYDYKVLQGLGLERFRPQVIITERNDDDGAKFNFLRTRGYRLAAELEFDTIWAEG